jgi:hypothetical protein
VGNYQAKDKTGCRALVAVPSGFWRFPGAARRRAPCSPPRGGHLIDLNVPVLMDGMYRCHSEADDGIAINSLTGGRETWRQQLALT